MGSAELLAPVAIWRKNLGQIIAPEVASQLARSIRSLPVRVHRQNDTAAAVAAFLTLTSGLSRSTIPGWPQGRKS
jgi:cystathionine gamma-synthase